MSLSESDQSAYKKIRGRKRKVVTKEDKDADNKDFKQGENVNFDFDKQIYIIIVKMCNL